MNSDNGARRSSRVTARSNAPAPAPRRRRDRRTLMVKILAGLLVLAMLLPVLAVFL